MQSIPLFGPSFSLDQTILPAIGDAALGVYDTRRYWSEKLQNPGQQEVRPRLRGDV